MMSVRSSVWFFEVFGFGIHFYKEPLDPWVCLNITRYPNVYFIIKAFIVEPYL